MKKLIYIIAAFLVFHTLNTNAQQIHQLTQYSLNDFAFNPAVVGKGTPQDYSTIVTRASYRRQWWGAFDGAEPTTMFISGHGNFSEKKSVGLGAFLYSDKTGPTRRLGFQLAYAYHIPLSLDRSHYLSLGISGGLINYALTADELDPYDINDSAIGNGDSQTRGDANFGAYLYGPNYWVGFSALQLIQSEFRLSDQAVANDLATIANARHFYGSFGYRFDLNEDFQLEPSALLKFVKDIPFSYELNAKAYYQNKYWAGLGYRSEDAVMLMLGIALDRGLNIAYSFDLITSDIKSTAVGSHEITIGYDISKQSETLKAKPFDYSRKKRKL